MISRINTMWRHFLVLLVVGLKPSRGGDVACFSTRPNPDPVTYSLNNARVLIAQVLESHPHAIVDAGINFLHAMAHTSLKSMTETEFNSLLAYAAHRNRIDCPGWRPKSHAKGGEQKYGKLYRCLSDYNLARADEVIHGLLKAVAEQMALLIGEHLTLLEFQRALVFVSTTDRPGGAEETSGTSPL